MLAFYVLCAQRVGVSASQKKIRGSESEDEETMETVSGLEIKTPGFLTEASFSFQGSPFVPPPEWESLSPRELREGLFVDRESTTLNL